MGEWLVLAKCLLHLRVNPADEVSEELLCIVLVVAAKLDQDGVDPVLELPEWHDGRLAKKGHPAVRGGRRGRNGRVVLQRGEPDRVQHFTILCNKVESMHILIIFVTIYSVHCKLQHFYPINTS